MSTKLDPVWPWSRLWEVLLQVPPSIRILAGLAALAALVLPILLLGNAKRPTILAIGTALLLCLAFLAWHSWSFALADGRQAGGSGLMGYLLGLLVQLGLMLLLIGPFALAGISVGSYPGSGAVSRKRLGSIIILRLAAFVMALFAITRPALAWPDREGVRSLLFLVVDHSRSMTIEDEQGGQSRWDVVRKSVKNSEAALERLEQEHQIDVRWFRFAGEVSEFDPKAPGEADGKRTDVGITLRDLFERRETKVPMRGLGLISDGTDNGTAVPSLAEVIRWRTVPCPVHTFACGSPKTSIKQNDVAITSISTSPSPFVPVKGKLKVKVSIDARGYENTNARVRLFLEGPDDKGVVADREVTAQDVKLPLSVGNEVTIVCDAPSRPGEVKVKVTVETGEPDSFPLNNAIETFVTVSKEGISVLLVDKPRTEPLSIYDALVEDPRIRVTFVQVRGGKPLARAGKLLSLEDQPYDVIILGDVTAAQMRLIDPEALAKIEKLVARGSGLMMIGGYFTFGNSDWKDTPLAPMLPVVLTAEGQDEKPVRMVPTEAGLRLTRYLFRLDDKPDLKAAWNKLAKLGGRTVLKLPEDRKLASETILAETEGNNPEPLLVMKNYTRKDVKGNPTGPLARVLAFAGDTTWQWVRNEEGARFHARFWKQVVVWLAKQEDAEGSVWVKPDVRRLPVRGELGFQVGMRGKGGGPDITGGKYEVEVIDPAGVKRRVPVVQGATENRGLFTNTQTPGIYRIVVRGQGKDPSGAEISGEVSARVIVYDEDVEMQRPASDPEFLRKLASAGGGEALRVEQLPGFLNRLAEQPTDRGKPKLVVRPDWRSTGRSSFLVGFFVAFCVLVSLEWGLRRWWGMV
jgi:uncharacterized membrane protein